MVGVQVLSKLLSHVGILLKSVDKRGSKRKEAKKHPEMERVFLALKVSEFIYRIGLRPIPSVEISQGADP